MVDNLFKKHQLATKPVEWDRKPNEKELARLKRVRDASKKKTKSQKLKREITNHNLNSRRRWLLDEYSDKAMIKRIQNLE